MQNVFALGVWAIVLLDSEESDKVVIFRSVEAPINERYSSRNSIISEELFVNNTFEGASPLSVILVFSLLL